MSKHWYWIEKRDPKTGARKRDKILPIMSVQMTNVEFDNERVVNKKHNIRALRTQNQTYSFLNPIPFTYSFTVKIAAEYMSDITQIMEQILPYFDPTNQIRITVPPLNINTDSATTEQGADSLELRVVYEGSNMDMQVEIEEANYRSLIWDLNFKVDGYLFRDTRLTKNIRKVVTKLYTTDSSFSYYASGSEALSGVGHDVVEVLTWATSATKFDDDGAILHNYEIFTEPEIIDYLLSMGISGTVIDITWDDGTTIIYE